MKNMKNHSVQIVQKDSSLYLVYIVLILLLLSIAVPAFLFLLLKVLSF